VPVHDLFMGTQLSTILANKRVDLRHEIDTLDVSDVLESNAKELCFKIVTKYSMHVPILHLEKKSLINFQDRKQDSFSGSIDVLDYTIAIPFEGDAELFSLWPSRYSTVFPRGNIKGQTLRLYFSVPKGKPETLEATFERELGLVNRYLDYVRQDVEKYNDALNQLAYETLTRRRQTLSEGAESLKALGIGRSDIDNERADQVEPLPKPSQSSGVSSPLKAKIFLSYARSDYSRARKLYDFLFNEGFSPWMDVEKLLPGEKWKWVIEDEIRKSDFFVACFSKNSVNKRGFLQKEIRIALDIAEEMLEEDIYLIPARLEQCEIPRRLADSLHWVDLFKPDGCKRLVHAVYTQMERRRQS
jgi:TIR domain